MSHIHMVQDESSRSFLDRCQLYLGGGYIEITELLTFTIKIFL